MFGVMTQQKLDLIKAWIKANAESRLLFDVKKLLFIVLKVLPPFLSSKGMVSYLWCGWWSNQTGSHYCLPNWRDKRESNEIHFDIYPIW